MIGGTNTHSAGSSFWAKIKKNLDTELSNNQLFDPVYPFCALFMYSRNANQH